MHSSRTHHQPEERIKVKLEHTYDKLGLTSHSVAAPISPDEIPDTQSPVGSLASTGWNAMSRGSMANEVPPNVRATLAVDVHGMVKPPCPSDCAPGIRLWTAVASAGGATIKVVPT